MTPAAVESAMAAPTWRSVRVGSRTMAAPIVLGGERIGEHHAGERNGKQPERLGRDKPRQHGQDQQRQQCVRGDRKACPGEPHRRVPCQAGVVHRGSAGR